MAKLRRCCVSIDADLLGRFDTQIAEEAYPTRSKALTDLIRDSIVRKEWVSGKEVAGTIILLFDHHKRDLTHRLTAVQHDFHELIISTQHIHLDHRNCLEIVVTKGRPKRIQALTRKLKAIKGVKHTSLAMAATGKGL